MQGLILGIRENGENGETAEEVLILEGKKNEKRRTETKKNMKQETNQDTMPGTATSPLIDCKFAESISERIWIRSTSNRPCSVESKDYTGYCINWGLPKSLETLRNAKSDLLVPALMLVAHSFRSCAG